MRRIHARAALVCLSLVAAVALAQSPATPVEPRVPGVAPPPAQAGDASGRAMQPHDDVDARACLEFVSNLGVIRCAEKYRNAHPKAAH